MSDSALAHEAPAGQRTAVEIRPLVSHVDYRRCVALQRQTWGDGFGDVVPASIQMIAQRLGGIAAGAFGRDDALLGFVFGMTGVEKGTVVHWSDMLAVAPEAQNQGIGRRLKEYQRACVATVGAKVIYWTYDPLVARNAHLNFNVFGVRVIEYVENMYGDSVSPLHRGIGTDRLIVSWAVDDGELARRRDEIARAKDGRARESLLQVAIPADIHRLQTTDMDTARAWRQRTRDALLAAFAKGYSIVGVDVNREQDRAEYLLSR